MRRLVFYNDETPPVIVSTVTCCDDAAIIDTAGGPKRVDTIVVGDLYRWPDGRVSSVGLVEVL